MIIGAGFSANAGLPTTQTVTESFLSLGESSSTPPATQAAISDILKEFWQDIFGYDGGATPSFEDHFTLVDLAANAGHSLGKNYTPAQLRAIRRLNIHRVFDILDTKYTRNGLMAALLTQLALGSDNTIVSTNWDIVVENHLQHMPGAYSYRLNTRAIPKGSQPKTDLAGKGKHKTKGKMGLLKLHGSANLAYCDSCRQIFKISGKGALRQGIFLEVRDFETLGKANKTVEREFRGLEKPSCSLCHAPLSARVATFSYSKALGYFQFQAVWDAALRALRKARTWVFFGYSLPEADFQIRHLLKTAQIGRVESPKILVALIRPQDRLPEKDRIRENYMRFFGGKITRFIDTEAGPGAGDVLLQEVTAALERR